MQAQKFHQLPWLPLTTVVSAVGGIFLLRTYLEPFGWGLIILSLDLLWTWQCQIRTIVASPWEAEPDSNIDWYDFVNKWKKLEKENQALREQAQIENKLLHGILANISVGVVLLGSAKQVSLFNFAAQRLLGSSTRALSKVTVSSILSDAESQSMLEKAYSGAFSVWNHIRSGRTLSFSATPISVQVGNTNSDWNGVLLLLQDITKQEALEQTRQKFIFSASNELKTPVTSIKTAAENLMNEGCIHPDGKADTKIILKNVDRMALLLNDIAELSRIETGALTLEYTALDLDTFLREVLENTNSFSKYKDIELELNIEPTLGAKSFLTDPIRLHQLLENLLSNALKVSPKKSKVVLSAQLQDQWIIFSVKDNGPGISLKDSSRIFERFYRTQTSKGTPGTGLGLAIVKHLARIMGGEVSFESVPDEETTFFVRLPWETVGA
ncbi:MAG: HAMP domain-containing histidine kinase [Holophagaceae bacterium]|nr:HAMP domain-containing histidine kinase [Holophagaceae bacterium]